MGSDDADAVDGGGEEASDLVGGAGFYVEARLGEVVVSIKRRTGGGRGRGRVERTPKPVMRIVGSWALSSAIVSE